MKLVSSSYKGITE